MGDFQAVIDVLGLTTKRPLSPLQLSDLLQKGLPIKSLNRVSSFLAPSDAMFKYKFVSKASLSRGKGHGKLPVDGSSRLARVAKIWTLALDVWGSEESTRAFLFRPHPMLEGRTPLDVTLASEVGADLVESILGGLKYGSAA